MFLEFDWIKINSKNNLMMTRAGLSGKKTIINSIQSVTFTSFAKMWLCHCFVFLPFLRLIFNADCSSVEAFGTGGVSVSNLTGGIALISTASMNQMSVWKNLGQSKTIPVVGWNQKKTLFYFMHPSILSFFVPPNLTPSKIRNVKIKINIECQLRLALASVLCKRR